MRDKLGGSFPGGFAAQNLFDQRVVYAQTIGEIGKRLGRKALQQVACVAGPDTILASNSLSSSPLKLLIN